MASDLSTIVLRETNDYLKSHIEKRDRASIHVLVLYWEDGEKGFRDEGRDVGYLFRDLFHYQVTEFPIPTVGSGNKLLGTIFSLLGDEPSLLIVYYGGHGDKDDDRRHGEERRAVWAAHSEGEPTVKWYDIQNLLIDRDCDILLLLDCCYAGQACRDRSSSRFDILAAAAMGVKTLSYGDGSFTTAMIREIRHAIHTDGYVDINHLHGVLVNRKQKLYAQPILTSLKPGPTIRLEPLSPSPSQITDLRVNQQSSFLQLFIHVKQEITQENSSLLKDWLTGNIPRFVSGMDLFLQTDHLRTTMERIEKGQEKGGYLDLESKAKEETTEAWGRVVDLFREFLADAPENEVQRREFVARRGVPFLTSLAQYSNEVMELLERSILTSPSIEREEVVPEALQDEDMQALGMVSQLTMRHIVNEYDSDNSSQEDLIGETKDGVFIRESKVYGPYDDPDQLKPRVNLLAKMLSTPYKHAEFRSLRCLGVSHQRFENKFTFAFEVPEEASGPEHTSLWKVIKINDGHDRPSLDDRLRIAFQLAQSLQKWHLVGWLHQGINSPNILFFSRKEGEEGLPRRNYSRPYLQGFEYARGSEGISLSPPPPNEVLDLYRHPKRQVQPIKMRHTHKHDFYSLGVVLLELGLWQTADSVIAKHCKDSKKDRESLLPEEIRQVFVKNCRKRVAHYAGERYQRVVETCLTGDFGVDLDDERRSHLIRAFYDKVVVELKKGVVF